MVAAALSAAQVDADSISYVETHGTGTRVGDPIEITALSRAFRQSTERRGFCAVGSLKSNVGHLDAAAGVAGLIKTVLSLEHKQIPPSLHFSRPNPLIDFASSPFYVNTRLSNWETNGEPRRAGVTSLGIGGTNAHVVLEEAPAQSPPLASRRWQILTVSAKTPAALARASVNLADHLEQSPELALPDVAFTCHLGRKAFDYRRAVVSSSREGAIGALRRSAEHAAPAGKGDYRRVVFLFPGQGSQYVHMARGIYEAEPVFREHVDRCAELLAPHLGLDLRSIIYPGNENPAASEEALRQTWITQPALFVIEYALAQLWMSWGIRPSAMIGHSLGEFVAATLSGVLSLEDALSAVAARGRLMQSLPGGAMLAVAMPEKDVHGIESDEISLASVNAPDQCVLSGPVEAIESLQRRLSRDGVISHRLQTSHAFHSAMMEPIVAAFRETMSGFHLQAPQIPVHLQCDRHLDSLGGSPGSRILVPSFTPTSALFGRAEGTAGRARQPGSRSRPRASPVRVCEAAGRVARGAGGLVPAHCRRNGGRHAIGVGGAGAAMGVLGRGQLGGFPCARAAAARTAAHIPVRAGKILDRSAGPTARPQGFRRNGRRRRCHTTARSGNRRSSQTAIRPRHKMAAGWSLRTPPESGRRSPGLFPRGKR